MKSSTQSNQYNMTNKKTLAQETTWQTKDGENMKVSDMADKHLKNTIRLLEYKPTVSVLVDDQRHNPEIAKVHDTEMIDIMKAELNRRT